mmetsp:Transcript_22094/g.66332  ORF Transcript_22094/g.66332 Transcript_22094/m.66332 type:complete len:365 (+) Transcript_22094:1474-2568(+)
MLGPVERLARHELCARPQRELRQGARGPLRQRAHADADAPEHFGRRRVLARAAAAGLQSRGRLPRRRLAQGVRRRRGRQQHRGADVGHVLVLRGAHDGPRARIERCADAHRPHPLGLGRHHRRDVGPERDAVRRGRRLPQRHGRPAAPARRLRERRAVQRHGDALGQHVAQRRALVPGREQPGAVRARRAGRWHELARRLRLVRGPHGLRVPHRAAREHVAGRLGRRHAAVRHRAIGLGHLGGLSGVHGRLPPRADGRLRVPALRPHAPHVPRRRPRHRGPLGLGRRAVPRTLSALRLRLRRRHAEYDALHQVLHGEHPPENQALGRGPARKRPPRVDRRFGRSRRRPRVLRLLGGRRRVDLEF